MPPKKSRPAWIDPVDDIPAPPAPQQPRSQYVHIEDDPNYVKPPPKRPSQHHEWQDQYELPQPPAQPKKPRSQYVHPEDDPDYVKPPPKKRAPARPQWENPADDPVLEQDPNWHNPVWAAEVVSMPHQPGAKRVRVREDPIYVHPEDDPNYKGPPRPDFEKSYVDSNYQGRRTGHKKDDPNMPKMVYRCDNCLAEFYSDNPTECPRCHYDAEPPRPTMGVMHPLIEAMQMIDDGIDPRTGKIDVALDRLVEEQMEAAGGKRVPPPNRITNNLIGKKRIIFYDPELEQYDARDSGVVVIAYHKLSAKEVSSKPVCTLCRMPMKSTQKIGQLKCGHMFHSNCLSSHFKKNETCPKCKAKIE